MYTLPKSDSEVIMTSINTVLGTIESSQLGYTLVHEHILSTSAGMKEVYPEFIDRESTIETATTHLAECKNEGIATVIDMAPFDLGRDVLLLQEVSKKSNINIITTTGSWIVPPREFVGIDPNLIAPLYVREIVEGIQGTGIKAGVIKISTDREGITERFDSVSRAVARAQLETKVPILTHTYSPAFVGNEQIRILQEEGVDLNRVCIGHSNDTTNSDYLKGILDKGAWLGLDHFPGSNPDWNTRTLIIKELIDQGYGDRIMLSHDFNLGIHKANMTERAARWERNPDGYLFIKRKVLPKLIELGVSENNVNALNTKNVQRFFENE